MEYKKKLTGLVCLIGVLALVYGGTLVFDPERVNSRNASFVWLNAEGQDRADRIEISRAGSEPITLIRKNNEWFVPREGIDFPAKQGRVEDLFRLLSTRGAYPPRASTAASHERLGLTEETASRIVIRGGAGAYPLLDLLIGDPDATGKEIYLRQNNQNEVRSGESGLSSYAGGSPASWCNLRLFPDSPGRSLNVDMIQGLRVDFPAPGADTGPAAPMVLVRSAGGWTLEGGSEPPDTQRVESYIRSILDAEGEDFAVSVRPEEPVFNDGRITLNTGDGGTHTIRLGPPGAENRRNAAVSLSPYVYTLGEWTVNRLFREAAYFVTR
ncbi:MAG: DUF4340 domain-containing protein [Spirochaetaceae bacterium]|jgi:hypothetical protein|nr:DUF4340 domain-containing protein [Spirochaetaceae bacterium]